MTTTALFDVPSVHAAAGISQCGIYRYWLSRTWDERLPVCWVMLNPSTANATDDDPTIRKCMGFARRWNAGGIIVLNLFAYRATQPCDLWRARGSGVDIIGPESDTWFRETGPVSRVIAAWGTQAARKAPERVRDIIGILKRELGRVPLECLKVTNDGQPWHPLYVPYSTAPTPFPPESDDD